MASPTEPEAVLGTWVDKLFFTLEVTALALALAPQAELLTMAEGCEAHVRRMASVEELSF